MNGNDCEDLLSLNSIRRRKNNGTMILVESRIPEGVDPANVFRDEADFVTRLYPFLETILPW